MRDIDSWLLFCQMELLKQEDNAPEEEVKCACAKLIEEEAKEST